MSAGRPRFAPGARVRIADRRPGGHHRTPWYLKGREATVIRLCGAFGEPEGLSLGGDGKPFQPLYRVRLEQRDLWPDYQGSAGDRLEAEIFEHWLEPA